MIITDIFKDTTIALIFNDIQFFFHYNFIINLIFASSEDKKNPIMKSSAARYGSFYLRVGAIAFGIGSMVYSGLEFGQYFELKGNPRYFIKKKTFL